jgi:hypothetical protein
MKYVYILHSIDFPVAITQASPHTSKFSPWELKTYVAFSDDAQAFAFEKYLKSASGRAFAKKRR